MRYLVVILLVGALLVAVRVLWARRAARAGVAVPRWPWVALVLLITALAAAAVGLDRSWLQR